MIRRPPRSTRTYTLFPYTTLFRSSEQDLSQLRKAVFRSQSIKEVGLFDSRYRLYCASNAGPTDLRLYKTIEQRLQQAKNRQTLSLTKAAISGEETLFIYAHNGQGGVNALLHPSTLLNIARRDISLQPVSVDVQVIGRSINQVDPLQPDIKFHSAHYPLSVALQLPTGFYPRYLLAHLWQGLLVASFNIIIFLLIRLHLQARNSLSHALQTAVANGELEVRYQPIVAAHGEQVLGAEALMRWHHPLQGMISPSVFIPLAEQCGQMVAITDYLLNQATEFIEQQPKLMAGRYISVNISRQHILQHDVAAELERRCVDSPALASHLQVEITEESDFSSKELNRVVEQLTRIKALGIRLAVDDFGTGYSGLNFIRQFHFDVLKLDQVFVHGMNEENLTRPLLQGMLSLAKQLNMAVIVEGVELQVQADELKALGATSLQGMLYAKPLPEAEFCRWLQASPLGSQCSENALRDAQK